MSADITIVSAFFDINRGQWGDFSRSAEMYTKHFSFWAGIKNPLIIYTMPSMAKYVYEIRRSKGLADLTTVVELTDIECLAPNILEGFRKTMGMTDFAAMRIKPDNPESVNPIYNYLMFLKSYFLYDAVQNQKVETPLLAWMDYGFNKSGEYYPCEDELTFEWKTNYDLHKLHFFSLRPIPEVPIHQMICKMSTYIQGTLFLVPTGQAKWFYEKICEMTQALFKCGLADDDQVLYVMLSREHPDICEVHPAGWGEGLKLSSGHELNYINIENRKPGKREKFLEARRLRIIKKEYLHRIKEVLNPLDW